MVQILLCQQEPAVGMLPEVAVPYLIAYILSGFRLWIISIALGVGVIGGARLELCQTGQRLVDRIIFIVGLTRFVLRICCWYNLWDVPSLSQMLSAEVIPSPTL